MFKNKITRFEYTRIEFIWNVTLRVFELCKKLKNLNNFVQISTCYVNCDKSGIIEEEILDDAYEDPVELVKWLLNMAPQELIKITPKLLGKLPNILIQKVQ